MFSRSIFAAFLTLALSVQALPQRQQECPAVSTVTQVRTVTVTPKAVAPTTTALGDNNNGKGANKKGAKTSPSAAAPTAASNNGGNKGNNNNNNGNSQTSTTLDPRVIAPGFANNGQDVPTAGQVGSLTSKDNFINFCLTVPNLPITNGKQITTGSCNPAPMGIIPSTDNMPSSKFTFPPNFGTIKAGQNFTIEMAIKNMQTGFFVNAQANYFAAPQQLNSAGQIQGHSHVVIEQLTALDQTTPTDPKKFAFFKGLNGAAQGGKLTALVTNGLQPGFYKLSSINTAANHQPVVVPVAQHGSLDDAIYFTVTADGKPLVSAGGGKNTPPAAGGKKPPPAVKSGDPKKAAAASPTPTPGGGNTNTGGRGKNNAAIPNLGNTPTPPTSSAPAASSTPAMKGGRYNRRALSGMA